MLARLAEAGGIELRIFRRDGQRFSRSQTLSLAEAPDSNADLMAEFLNRKNGQAWQSIPVVAFYTKTLEYLYHYVEYPAIYHKDRVVGHLRAPRPARLRRRPRRGAPGSSSSCWTRRSSTSGSAPPWTRCSACSTSAWSWARSRSGREEAMGDELLCSVADGVATVTLNRPAKRNALNRAVLEGLAGAFERLEGDPTVRVVVVRGAGPAFCSGMDLDELARQQNASADPETSVVSVLRRIEQCRHPTLAVVHGDAFAGGCALALP